MKNMLNSLKGFDYQKFFLQHGEKVGFGLTLIIVVALLATTRWTGFDKRPSDLMEKAEAAAAALDVSEWPKKEQDLFAASNFYDQAIDLVSRPLADAPFLLSRNFSDPLYPRKEPASEPEFLPIEFTIAQAVRFPAVMNSGLDEESMDQAGADQEKPAEDTEEEDPDVRVRRPGTAGAGSTGATQGGFPPGGLTPGGLTPGGLTPGGAALPPTGLTPGAPGTPGANTPTGDAAGVDFGLTMTPGGRTPGDGGGQGTVTTDLPSYERVNGKRAAVITGIYPLRTQLETYRRALRVDRIQDIGGRFLILDRIVERQQAIPGPDPWAGPWVEVKFEDLETALGEMAMDYEDPVAPMFKDDVLTAPLPMRALGIWGENASHPRLKLYELTAAQRAELEKKEREAAAAQGAGGAVDGYSPDEMAAMLGLDGAASSGPQRRGFGRTGGGGGGLIPGGMTPGGMTPGGAPGPGSGRGSRPPTGMPDPSAMTPGRSSAPPPGVLGAPGRGATPSSMTPGSGVFAGSGNAGYAGMGMNFGTMTYSPTTQVLLFRYFDFQVDPGECYRYRVKVVLQNPNKDMDVAMVQDPAFIKGDTRTTEWSKPTNPIVVPDDSQVFLVGVDQRERTRGNADVKVIQWTAEHGTYIDATLPVTFGQLIGGTARSKVLDIAVPSLEDKEQSFLGRDVLVDTFAAPQLDLREHSDLGLKPVRRAGVEPVGVADEMLVVDRYGQLVAYDSESMRRALNEAESLVLRERRPFEELAKRKTEESALDRLGSGGFGSMPPTGYNPTGEMPMGTGASTKGKTSGKSSGRRPTTGSRPPGQ